ncbi:MAG: acyl-CoA dehydrogenase [Mariprofundaceae bacterium]
MLMWCIIIITVTTTLAFVRASLSVWTLSLGALLTLLTLWSSASTTFIVFPWLLYGAVFIPLNIPSLRMQLVSRRVLVIYRKLLPPISGTERAALDAGNTWWDAELFSGKPDWQVLRALPAPALSEEEEAFLDGPVDQLCAMLDDWKITHEDHDLSRKAWRFIKQKGFFGLIIPKRYGGLEFSAQAHSAVVAMISSKSATAAVTAMVPNSLGPGQLLLNYGTEAQKDHYLPRLAKGKEIPCFALTSPTAGSDAASMTDRGVVCRGEVDGEKDVLGIRLNWDKRYITLAPVATLLGLAFKLFDPDHLLGDKEDIGITLALIPTDTTGVEIGRRHFPLNMTFQNGPTQGKDVFIPIDWIIGGPEYAGQGWRMLMDCLAEGRSISLPALSVGAGKVASRATGAYARVRRQFKVPIGKFEGVEEALARIAGNTYAIDAARQMTAVALDQGEKPSVISAIVKYHCTERMRALLNDAMDVFGGSAICLGPRNLLGRVYQSIPISITVEGANILTRSLIIFGQGVTRCHPYLLQEMQAAQNDNEAKALADFDRAFFAHLGFSLRNAVRSLLLAISFGRLARPPFSGPTAGYARHVERLSAALALVSDITLFVLGGALKRKEKLSARLGDVLAALYFTSATIKHFESQGRQQADIPLLQWACEDALHSAEKQMDAFLLNFPSRPLAVLLRLLIFPLGKRSKAPSDTLGHQVARLLLEPSEARDRLTHGIYCTENMNEPIGRIESAFAKVIAASAAEHKLNDALKQGLIEAGNAEEDIDVAVKQGAISSEEAILLHDAFDAVQQAIAVDTFSARLESDKNT